MALGLPYLTSNTKIAYPFKENAEGLVYTGDYTHGSSATIPLDFITDARITAPQGVDRVYLHSITKLFGGQSRFTFRDAAGVTIFTYDLAPVTLAPGKTFTTVDMSSVISYMHVRFVVGTPFINYLSEIATTDTFQTRLPFDEYAVTYVSKRVQEFMLASIPPGMLHQAKGLARFTEGYNTNINIVGVDPVNDVTTIRIDVQQNAGMGLNPCIDVGKHAPPLGLIPDDGNIIIDGDDTLDIIPHIDPVAKTVTFELQSNAEECCTCHDYLQSAQALKNLILRVDNVRKELLNFHTVLTSAIENYNIEIAKKSECVVGLMGALGGSGSDNNGNIVVFVGNRSKAENINVTSITVTSPGTIVSTNFKPTTIAGGTGVSFYFIGKTATPLSVWAISAVVTYTYKGVTKTITKEMSIS